MTTRNRRIASLNRAIREGHNRQRDALNRAFEPVNAELERTWARIRRDLDDIADGQPENPDDFSAEGFAEQAEPALERMEGPMVDNAAAMETAGAAIGVRAGAANLALGGVRIAVTSAIINRVRAGITYVDSPAFRDAVNRFAPFHAQAIADQILRAIATGQNPRETARRIVAQYQMAYANAINLTRTTQIYSARRGNRLTYAEANIREWLWSAALDERTCMGCIAMHGTRHPISEELNDHHRGRCAAIPITPTWEELGFTGGVDPTYETGPEWFMRQDEVTQLRILGPTLFNAWQGGEFAFTPDVIVTTYDDPIFGQMRRPRTVQQIIGRR